MRETVANAEDTEQSELPDIVPPTQTITRGRKCSQNECDANVEDPLLQVREEYRKTTAELE